MRNLIIIFTIVFGFISHNLSGQGHGHYFQIMCYDENAPFDITEFSLTTEVTTTDNKVVTIPPDKCLYHENFSGMFVIEMDMQDAGAVETRPQGQPVKFIFKQTRGGVVVAEYTLSTTIAGDNPAQYAGDGAGMSGPGICLAAPIPSGPSLSITDEELCSNGTGHFVTATVTDAPSGGYQIAWGNVGITSDGTNKDKGNIDASALGLAVGQEHEITAELLDAGGNSLSPQVMAKYKIKIKAVPNVTLTGNNEVCEGGNVTLTAGTDLGTSYAWTGGPMTAGSGDHEKIAAPVAGNNSYQVSVTHDGCTGSASKTITINALPQLSVNSEEVCKDEAKSITASMTGEAGSDYIWNVGATTYNGATISLTLSATTHYEVKAKNAKGCEGQKTGNITVIDLPSLTLTGPSQACSKELITLTASNPAGTYGYEWDNLIVVGNPTQTNVVENKTNEDKTYTYKVRPTQGACKGAWAEHTVTIKAEPVFTVSATPTTGAEPLDVALEVNMTNTVNISGYNWTKMSGPASAPGTGTGNPFSLTGLEQGSYSYKVQVETDATCSNEGTVSFTVTAPGAPLAVNPTGGPFCADALPATINANSSGGIGPFTYVWNAPAGVNLSSTTDENPQVLGTSTPGTYTVSVTVTDGSNNSTANGSLTLVIDQKPQFLTSGATPSSIKEGESSQLSVTVDPGTSTVTWTGGTFTSPQTGLSVSTGVINTANTYTYTATAVNGQCTTTESVTLTVTVPGAALAVNPTGGPFCADALPASINANPSGGIGPFTYVWSAPAGVNLSSTTDENPQVLGTSTPGTYTVSVTVTDGSDNSTANGSFTLVIDQKPQFLTSGANPSSINAGGSSQLSVTVDPGTSTVTWTGGTFTSPQTGLSVSTGVINTANTYTYTATAQNGQCSATEQVSLTVNAVGGALAVNPTGGPFCADALPASINANPSGGTGPFTYVWNAPAGVNLSSTTDQNPLVQATSTPGTYTVSVTVTDGSDNSTANGSFTLVIDQKPQFLTFGAAPSSINIGESSQLSVTVNPATAGVSWSGGTFGAPISGTSVNTGIINTAGNYTYTATATNGQCIATQLVPLQVQQQGMLSGQLVVAVEPSKCALPGTKMRVDFTASSSTPGATYSFQVYDKNSSIILNVNPSAPEAGPWFIEVSDSQEGTYTVSSFRVHQNGAQVNGTIIGADGSGQFGVAFKALPIVSIAEAPMGTVDHCLGDAMTLTAGGSPGTLYTWSNGIQNGMPFNPSSGGQYTVIATGDNGCTNSKTVTVNVHQKPSIITATVSEPEICQGESVVFNASSSAGSTISWSDGIMNGIPYTPSVAGNPMYTVKATSSTAPYCYSERTLTVTVHPRTEIYHTSRSPRKIAIDKDVYFAVKARGKNLNYQWYRKQSGMWMPLSNNSAVAPYIAGANTDSLILKTVPQSWDQSEFKVIVQGECGQPVEAEFQLFVSECFAINLDFRMGQNITPNTDPASNVHGYFCVGTEISMVATITSDEGYEITNPKFKWYIDGEEFRTEHWDIDHSVSELKWIPNLSFEEDILVKVCVYSDGACEEICSKPLRIKARKYDPVEMKLLSSTGNTYCPGDTVDFWVDSRGAGVRPTYVWYNDVYKLPEEQSPSNELLYYDQEKIRLVMGQEDTWVRVIMTPSPEVCYDRSLLQDTLFMRKKNMVNPTLTIINDINDTLACTGDGITFTAQYTDAGSNPNIFWQKDIWNLGYGETAFAQLDDKDMWIKCTMIPGKDVCYIGDTLVATMKIAKLEQPSVTIWANMDNKGPGDEILIESTVENMPSNPIFSWYVNNNLTFSNDDYYTSSTLRQGDVVMSSVRGDRICQNVVFSNELMINFGTRSRDTIVTIYKGESVSGLDMKINAEDEEYIFTIEREGQALHGRASISSVGIFNYTPYDAAFVGSDEVRYKLTNKYDKSKVFYGTIYIDVRESNRFRVPNIITPNGDGLNDTWILDFLVEYPNHLVTVYNRNGKMVYQTKNYQNDWDGIGQSSGNYSANYALPPGVYTYVINLGNKQILKGWVEIRRDINLRIR